MFQEPYCVTAAEDLRPGDHVLDELGRRMIVDETRVTVDNVQVFGFPVNGRRDGKRTSWYYARKGDERTAEFAGARLLAGDNETKASIQRALYESVMQSREQSLNSVQALHIDRELYGAPGFNICLLDGTVWTLLYAPGWQDSAPLAMDGPDDVVDGGDCDC